LRGVNDEEDVLVSLSEELVRRRVFPYYLHHTDRVSGTAHFWVEGARGRALHQGMARRVSGLALPAYVWDPPDGSGKRPVSQETP
jgi:lysine 2,3-aminomutase